MAFIGTAKNHGISVILVGHVNKEGGIAGPKVLEHTVDAVLCFAGVDFVALFTGAQACFSFFGYLLAGVAAFGGAYVGIKLMLYLMVQIGISSFAYYSWGAALFTLILYLMT